MKILKVEELDLNGKLVKDFINAILYIKESENSKKDYKRVQKKILSDLKLNIRLIGTFGAGIGAFYPVVHSLMDNMGMKVELTDETIVLATICAITIILLEEKELKDEDEAKSMLEELKMKGVGNGIIKKIVKCFKSIFNILKIVFKYIGAIINAFVDMFSYTAMLIPIMNAINSIIDKYDFTPETLIQNFIGLGIGITTISAKHALIDILDKIKDKLDLSKDKEKNIKDLVDELSNIDIDDIKEISDELIDSNQN